MEKTFSLKLAGKAFKRSFKGFSDHKVTKLSASLAYYTIFSIGPMLIVIIYLASLLFAEQAVKGTIYTQLEGFIGANAASQVQTIIQNAGVANQSGVSAVIGILALLVGATTVFAEMQDSMNSIWGVKADPKKSGILKLLMTRLVSFGVVASLGFLLLVSLVVSAVVAGLGNKLQQEFPQVGFVVIYIINLGITLLITTLLFAVIFKVLPNLRIRWRHVWFGSMVTAILFLLGKIGISFYISQSDIGSTYGAAGSLVILILWIYYSSVILYYGAEYTKSYAFAAGARITPDRYANWSRQPAIAGAQADAETELNKEAGDVKPVIVQLPTIEMPEREKGIDGRKKAGLGLLLVGLIAYAIHARRS